MGLGEATARGASDCVSCPASRAHSDLCFRTLDNDSVWHALLRAPGYPPAWRRRIQGRLGVKRKLVSRAGHAAVVGALQGVERAPVRRLRKKMPWGHTHQLSSDPGPDRDPTTQKCPSCDDGGQGGPAPTFPRGARRLSFKRAGRGVTGHMATGMSRGRTTPSLDTGRVGRYDGHARYRGLLEGQLTRRRAKRTIR